MKRTNAMMALTVAASMPVSGCATTHLSGEYRTEATDLARKEESRELAKGSEWLFFWGLLDTGSFNLDRELKAQLREDECVTNLEVKDRLSIGGAFLWIITAGIVSHHSIVASGQPAIINRPPAEKSVTGPARERETILVPAPSPAGYPRSSDYSEGYRAGVNDRTSGAAGGPGTGRSKDYEDGYKDGLKDTGGR